MFEELKKKLQENFAKLSKEPNLFYVTIDRDQIWEQYLKGWDSDPVEQQSHNCNCCKSFLRQWAGIVAIIGNKKVSIWDGIEVKGYEQSIQNLRDYIHSLPITDVFLNETGECGTNKNLDVKRNVTWTHFCITLPAKFVNPRYIDTARGEKRDNKNLLKRSLDELTLDATETILELIAQNSLYRGKEFEPMLMEFQKLQREYSLVANKDNFCWVKSTQISQALSRIRNTSIGTLLINLSEGMDLDAAVGKFEAVVAPTNYKRPTSLVTPKMVEQAKAKLIELGLLDSLERRFAKESDLNVNDILFTDKSSSITGDVFDTMAKEGPINPKSLTKIEEVSIEDFVNKILPTSKSVEVLLENSHLSNMVSLINSTVEGSPSLFKWNNNFSWSYTGGITDSIKERVKAAGGKVDGVLRFSIQWNDKGDNNIDFDAHAIEPNGIEIYYGNCRKPSSSAMTGQLDVDIISPGAAVAVENITWADRSKMRDGIYKFFVKNFSSHTSKGGFTAQIEFDGQVFDFEYGKNLKGNENIYVAEVKYSRATGFEIKTLMDSKTSIVSKEKWGVSTNQFHKVTKMMLSPNHWNASVGNKHYLFLLENCISDESPRPFFNEFLKQEFDENRKVFEIMASKLKVPPTADQLSGIGFSDTQKNHVIVRVQGAFKRTIKVNF